MSHPRALSLVLCLSLIGPSLLAASPKETAAGDRAILVDSTDLVEGPLPRGPLGAPQTILAEFQEILALTVLPTASDELLLLRRRFLPFEAPRDELVVVDAAGGLEVRGRVELPDGFEPQDIAFSPDGRLYVLASLFWWNPPELDAILVEVDFSNGDILAQLDLEDDSVARLATTPAGLWALSDSRVQRLDPVTGQLAEETLPLPAGSTLLDADGDSTGALWILTQPLSNPATTNLHRLDPATGSLRKAVLPHPAGASHLAIRRRCADSPTAVCLQGGRFQVEADWRIASGATGVATVGPSKSADSAVLWFFDKSNWELLVKVLDACGSANPRFWVFAAGTTNVEYTLRVTDLQTGESRHYTNPLGQTASAITDTSAFATCP